MPCDRCCSLITVAERALGWPVSVSVDETSYEDICPSCYGDDASCGECGDTLQADEGAVCLRCTRTTS